MLKNKFGMLKVLALALSVLMLVSLVACGNDGMSDDEIQNAINAAVSANQAEQDKAIADAAAAAKAEAEAAAKAAAEAAAAEAAAKAEAASKAAADAEAKAKAAEEAAAAAKKQASEDAAKAAESAKKAAEDAKKAEEAAKSIAASISKSQAEAAKTTTAAPVIVDKTAVQAEFAKLKHEYTYTKAGLYLTNNYAELVLLFDAAAVELQNAATLEAAQNVLETVKVSAAAVESAQTRANEVQALIADLGDIESEVFTTQAAKIKAARKAYDAFKKAYKGKVDANVFDAKGVVAKTIDLDDLARAEAKLEVLTDYITGTLIADMEKIYNADSKGKYEAEDDYKNLATATETYETILDRAYYTYRILSVVNGGDMSNAKVAIDWEYKYDEETGKVVVVDGKKVYNTDKPTAFFTFEDLFENYILPTLDAKFETAKAAAVVALAADLDKDTYNTIVSTLNANYVADWSDVEDIFEDAVEAYEEEIAGLTFVGDYKGNVVFNKAVADLYNAYAKAYVEAVASIVDLSKAVAIDYYTESVYEAEIEALEAKYEDEKYASILADKLVIVESNLDKFVANVNAAPVYDFASINNADLRKAYNKDLKDLTKYISENGLTTDFYKYVNTTVAKAIADNFKTRVAADATQEGQLGELTIGLVEDLELLLTELNKAEEGKLWNAYKGSAIVYLEESYSKDAVVAELYNAVEKAIADIKAIDVANYADKTQALIYPKTTSGDFKSWSEKPLYFLNAEAKAYAEAEKMDEATLKANAKALLTTTANDYPLTYTWTAVEQACGDAAKIYADIYATVNTKLVSEAGVVSTNQKLITNDTEYKAILTNVAAATDLKAEVEAFAAIYTKAISDLAALKNVATLPTFVKTSNVIATTHATINTTAPVVAEAYVTAAAGKFTELSAKMAEQVAAFEGKFWANDAQTTSNVVELWKYKTEAVAKITAVIASYKNTYTTNANGVVTQNATATGYAYDAGLTAVSAKGAAYEAQLNSYLADYTSKIMAVKLETKNAELKNALGTVILAKASDYSIAQAKAIVDAYVVDLCGNEASVWNGYKFADSRIMQAYKLNILNNYDTIVLG